MIVNIGAQSTQFSIITDGKIIIAKKIPIGGRQMNEAICSEIRKRYNLQIGTRTGKRLKIAMGRLNDPVSYTHLDVYKRQPYHCPHGRPTIIAMTRTELEKKFKRIV